MSGAAGLPVLSRWS